MAYSPFMANVGATVGNAMIKQGQTQQNNYAKKLYSDAYMGNQQALQELRSINPELAANVDQTMRQREQDELAATTRKNQAVSSLMQEAAKFDTYEEAAGFVDGESQRLGLNFPPFTEEAYNQSRTRFPVKPVDRNTATVKDGESVIDTDTGEVVHQGVVTEDVLPPVLLEGLDPGLADRGKAAYSAAGGGDKGMKAFERTVEIGQENQRRREAPQALAAQYPKASESEMAQLQAAMDSAETVEKGLKAAAEVREKQFTDKKAQDMADRSVDLVNKILKNPELNDVLGAHEGADKWYVGPRSDAEAEAIADIEELVNILTVPNMKLMTGILSETDLKLLMSIAGGGLNRTRGEERFIKDVTELRNALQGTSGTIDRTDKADAPVTSGRFKVTKVE